VPGYLAASPANGLFCLPTAGRAVVQELKIPQSPISSSHTCRSRQVRHYWVPHASIQDSPAEVAYTQRPSSAKARPHRS
jgi:hypothetical protein